MRLLGRAKFDVKDDVALGSVMAEVALMVSEEEAPDIYKLSEEDAVEVGPFTVRSVEPLAPADSAKSCTGWHACSIDGGVLCPEGLLLKGVEVWGGPDEGNCRLATRLPVCDHLVIIRVCLPMPGVLCLPVAKVLSSFMLV